ncbi:MAG: hypothetical protein SGJ09_01300 [Phycisphaerae bacterium]|nr:hypothetical protein [Phycisphaerae bacterium]
MKTNVLSLVAATCGFLAVAPTSADTVNVLIRGTVEYNEVISPPLNAVPAASTSPTEGARCRR